MSEARDPDPILDAAQQVFEQYGARRANVDDIARLAGISRSTLYRRYPTKEALLDAVLVRQVDAFLTELDRVAADLPPQEAVIECFVRGIALTREVPLLGRLAQAEPETYAGAGARSHGTMLLGSTGRVAATLRRSGATMPDEELLVVAEHLLRVASTYLISPGGQLDVGDEHAVRDYAKRFLAHLVN
ncbi:MAG: TetR family transcriptional regulator [Nocardioides sp.]|nr:TetR family transcriptional regulator [Nocardioides sp.]